MRAFSESAIHCGCATEIRKQKQMEMGHRDLYLDVFASEEAVLQLRPVAHLMCDSRVVGRIRASRTVPTDATARRADEQRKDVHGNFAVQEDDAGRKQTTAERCLVRSYFLLMLL
jgi:hypothetical protein